MKKFSKILEENENEKYFKIHAIVDLIVPAENEGEAGYLSDSILAAIDHLQDYSIDLIQETDERIITENIEASDELSNGKTPEEIIELSWDSEFGGKNPTQAEKMEWYHKMRNKGYDGIVIFDTLKDKF